MTEKGNSSSVMLSLPQMVDLALNSPDPGVINFNLLHNILHIMIQQLNLLQCNVEYRGEGGEEIQHALEKSSRQQSFHMTEYVISPEKEAGKKVSRGKKHKKDKKKEDEVTDDDLDATSMETVVVVETSKEDGGTQHVSVAISRTQIDHLSQEITNLKQKILELTELPNNLGLVDAIRNASGTNSPVLDMFQILSLSKRIDAAEIGMEKLASLMEDVVKKSKSSRRERSDKSLGGKVVSVESIQGPGKSHGKHGDAKTRHSKTAMSGALAEEVAQLKLFVEELASSIAEGRKMKPSARISSTPVHRDLDARINVDDINQLIEDVRIIKERLNPTKRSSAAAIEGESLDGANETIELPPEVRLTELEEKFTEYYEQLTNMDGAFNTELTTLHNQFTDLERDFNNIIAKLQGSFPAGDETLNQAGESANEVYKKLLRLQDDIDQVAETAAALLDDKLIKEKDIETLLEQVELLKTVKADREDIEDALAEKADACTVNRKVSHDQFDTACDELSKGIEEALSKLTAQEALWQQALDDIQNEIGTKLDKMDLGPLREFVNNKLKMLQDRMKALAALRKDQEAAGTKSKFLRNVNCISCDKDVVMRKEMDPSLRPKAYSAPPRRSMGPYLAYELDALRKQQKQIPGSRNLNHFENALTAGKSPRKDDDHICNRYCGGSHTVTTPQQRVTRLGHFLQQWGPEAVAQTDAAKAPKKASLAIEIKVDAPAKKKSVTSTTVIIEKEIVGSISSKTPSLTKAKSKSKSLIIAKSPSITSGKKSITSQKQGSVLDAKIQEETASQIAAEEPPPTLEEGAEAPPAPSGSAAEVQQVPAEAPPADAPPADAPPAEGGDAPAEAPPPTGEEVVVVVEEVAAEPPPADVEPVPPAPAEEAPAEAPPPEAE